MTYILDCDCHRLTDSVSCLVSGYHQGTGAATAPLQVAVDKFFSLLSNVLHCWVIPNYLSPSYQSRKEDTCPKPDNYKDYYCNCYPCYQTHNLLQSSNYLNILNFYSSENRVKNYQSNIYNIISNCMNQFQK